MNTTTKIGNRIRIGLLAVCLLGCGQQPEARLKINSIGVGEKQVPIIFGLDITNVSDTVVTLDRCDPEFTFTHLVAGDVGDSDLPKDFLTGAALSDKQSKKIEPGETVVVPVALGWQAPPSLPVLMVCETRLTLRYDGAFGVTTEPVTIVLAGSIDSREAVLAGPILNVEEPDKLASHLEGLDGQKSPSVLRLIEVLRKTSNESPEAGE